MELTDNMQDTVQQGGQPQQAMPTTYDPAAIEGPLFESWYNGGYFHRDAAGYADPDAQPYTIVIPPPNVTGMLHMGHALNDTIQDVLTRRARMQRKRARWIVGTDHAGIATQNRVEKRLADRGLTRFDVGREQFVQECWKWREEYGNTIIHQMKSIGCSCDYDDEKFTMSPEYQKAIRHVFVDWYNRGLIYRGHRIINWCPRCTTALSDAEVEHADQPEKGHLWYLRYPLKQPVDGIDHVLIATTRPETMLGDTAVAVNPDDERYGKLVGATVVLPIVNREIPVIADSYVDTAFGTGMVKITPAHDPNDFEVGLRHNLEAINILNPDATINQVGGEFEGLDRYEARKGIVARFEELGLLDHIEDHEHAPGHCYRCDTVIEPWLSDQWFVKMRPLADMGLEAVAQGRTKFYPERWTATYNTWLENIQDWCISRQLWWGHRIPVFYCDQCGWEGASEQDIDTCPTCGAPVRQDEDVLDTWFSSQLWPFATMGWLEGDPAEQELRDFYPTQVLSTAPDILYLWVARMIMSSLDFVDEIPFSDVILHPTVLDKNGDRMSKSKGNGIDPIDLINDYGADAMRFHLVSRVTGAQSFKLDPAMIVNDRNFITKIWNAARYVLMNMDGYEPGEPQAVTPADHWILSRLAGLVSRLDQSFETYELDDVARDLYRFFWDEFCDWYLEFSKGLLRGDHQTRLATQRNLVFVLDQALRLLHPIMPFVTDEIWRKLPLQASEPTIMVAQWPDANELSKFADPAAERAIELVRQAVSAVRSTRARYQIGNKKPIDVVIKTANPDDVQALQQQSGLVDTMANVGSLQIAVDAAKPAAASATITDDLEVYVGLEGLVDLEAERARLAKSRDKLLKDKQRVDKKLSNQGFLDKAAPEVIEKTRNEAAELADALQRLEAQLAELG